MSKVYTSHRDQLLAMAQVDVHGFDVSVAIIAISIFVTNTKRRNHILRESIFTELAPDTGLLVSSEGNLGIKLIDAVDLPSRLDGVSRPACKYHSPRLYPLAACDLSQWRG